MAYQKVMPFDAKRWVKLSFTGGGHRLTLGPSMAMDGWATGAQVEVEVDVDVSYPKFRLRVDSSGAFTIEKGRGGIYIQLPKLGAVPVPAKPVRLDIIAASPKGIEVEVSPDRVLTGRTANGMHVGEIIAVASPTETVPDDDGDFPSRGTAFGDWINDAVDKAVGRGATLVAARAAVLDQDMDYWRELMASATSSDDAGEEIAGVAG